MSQVFERFLRNFNKNYNVRRKNNIITIITNNGYF